MRAAAAAASAAAPSCSQRSALPGRRGTGEGALPGMACVGIGDSVNARPWGRRMALTEAACIK